MTDFALDAAGDLIIPPMLVTGKASVRQSIQIRLAFFKGEWFLDQIPGMPYFQQIFPGKTKNGTADVDAIVKNEILSTENVLQLTSFSSSLVDRKYSATFTADTTFGEVTDTWQA